MHNVYASCRSMCTLDNEPEQPLHQAEEPELTPRERATVRKKKRRATVSSLESLFLTLSASFSVSLHSCTERLLRFIVHCLWPAGRLYACIRACACTHTISTQLLKCDGRIYNYIYIHIANASRVPVTIKCLELRHSAIILGILCSIQPLPFCTSLPSPLLYCPV